MKRVISFLGVLVFSTTTFAMEIGIIRQFDNRRPALRRFKVDNIDLQDVNQDGTPDIPILRDSILHVIDPLTQENLWQFDMTTLGDGWQDMRLLGFMMMDGEIISHAVVSPRDAASGLPTGKRRLYLVNIQTDVIDFIKEETEPIAVLQRPNNGRQVLMAIDTWEHSVIIIGDTGDSNTMSSGVENDSRRLTSFTGGDYQIGVKFQADPGLRLAYDPDLFDPQHDLDLDGDERMDIAMLIEDANNQPTGVLVRSSDSFDVLWQFPFPETYKENILKGFWGFADVNGDGEKEAILGENLAVTLDGTVHTIAENFITFDVNDVDGDGYEDIIGLNTSDSTVMVYGTMTATSVADYDPAAIHFQLFQNYPNPFNPSTTISYSVAAAGDVQLQIYNALGQVVRTLFSGRAPAGNYTLTWDGRDDGGRLLSSGPYFYRLRVGETVLSRRMIFLK
ncbi:T9SS C-terminal target domain-containing protein [Candidatus Parcubacteria bacterium]|nr:MAG: T9SS C-terminal target domain-containing protein [Candidatus Parcubacteria bacterium]